MSGAARLRDAANCAARCEPSGDTSPDRPAPGVAGTGVGGAGPVPDTATERRSDDESKTWLEEGTVMRG